MEQALSILPQKLRQAITELPERDRLRLEELRLRSGQAAAVVFGGKERLLGKGITVDAQMLQSVVVAAACKFVVQYLLIVKWIAPAFLPPKAQAVMAVNFGVMQFFTACIGGVIACLIYLAVRKGINAKT